MKKTAAPFLVLGLALGLVTLALPGCVRSINPIGTEDGRVFDSHLIGVWGSDDEPDLYEVTSDGQGGYHLASTEKDCHRGTFAMHLTELDGHRFLDVYPDEQHAYENEFYASLLIRAFLVVRIEVTENEARTWVMDPDWLDEHLEAKPGSVARATRDDALLTGPTEQVRKLYLEYFGQPEALKEPGQLIRLSPERVKELRLRCPS